MRSHIGRWATALLVTLALVAGQGTWALAGTTGSLSGTIGDEGGAPVAGATVTVSSPSQTASTTSDAAGRFRFLSLAPDTYTVSVDKDGYNPVSLSGQTVFADNSQTVAITMPKALTQIAKVSSRASGNLVKPGTTSDVYSVNAATQSALAGIGGGYNLNNAYSAIYSQPGVSSIVGNSGQGQVFYIRGASYSQTGYEFDGVPVNRAFDNYNGNSLSNLGQQELQVYTGGSPSSGTSATLGGYVNQVIKTGTYPGSGTMTLGLGAPTFYHKMQIDAGGATPNRMFSWYAGFQGYNQDYRVVNNQNAGNLATDGSNGDGFFGVAGPTYALFQTGHYTIGPFPTCANQDGLQAPAGSPVSGLDGVTPVCYQYGVPAAGYLANTSDREVVFNAHFGIAHKNDGGKDDIQLLYDSGSVHSQYADSINDFGGLPVFQRLFNFLTPNLRTAACFLQGGANNVYTNGHCPVAGSPTPFSYQDGFIFSPGTQFGAPANTASVSPYYFPNSPTNRALYSSLPADTRGATWNDVGIVKVQYQKNFGSNAYARVYGYSFYSDWLQNNPNTASLYYGLVGTAFGAFGASSPNYELNTHSRGFSFEYANQINAQNLLRFTANYVTATLNRYNNNTWQANNEATGATSLADANGNCYNRTTGALASCFSSTSGGSYAVNPGLGGVGPTAGHPETACAYLPAASPACLANASYLVTRPAGSGTTNNVTPKFTYVSLEDEFRPNDKLDLNIGLRAERYQYDLANGNTPQMNFWFNAASHVYCYDPVTLQPILAPITAAAPPPAAPFATSVPGGPCPNGPSGQPGVHPDGTGGHLLFTAVAPSSLAHTSLSPRIGGTFTVNPDTVLRFSAGRYTQPTPAAFEQYLDAYGRSAAKNDFARFFGFGFTNPAHDNPVQTSNNYDFSFEKHFKGTDVTMRISPFFRYTTHQAVTVPLGPNFVSAVNLGTQKSTGVEFQIQKGDPGRDGLSGAISYTYTAAKIRFENGPNGRNAIDTVNDYIKAYNALTGAGGGAACYSTSAHLPDGTNAPDPGCAPTSIRNPYFGMTSQPLLDRTGFYDTYPNAPPLDAFPGAAGESTITAIDPNVITGFVQYKHGKLAIAPNFILAQGAAGGGYGSPTSVIGLDPRTCDSNQAFPANTYPAVVAPGNAAGQYANFYSCGATTATANGFLAIPDPYTGGFDRPGAFREPWQLNVGAQVRYDFTPKVTGTLNLTNLFNRCFGGSKMPWSTAFQPNSNVCGYNDNTGTYVGNAPGAGFFYGTSPSDPANGTSGFPKAYRYPYAPFIGNIPFQAYFELNIKL